jgi:dihydrofolate reductase
VDQLNNADLLLFGRITYELMASYWPTENAVANDPIVAAKMNAIAKIVFSRTLEEVKWSNTRLVKDNIAEEVLRLKRQPGKEIGIFGSSDLTAALMQMDLIDEYRIMVNPIILGSGKPLFNGIRQRINLKLLETKTFSSGNVLLYYQPIKLEGRG